MIAIVKLDGRRQSCVLCDHCQQPIRDAALAVAFVDENYPASRALHAHKGTCHTTLEAGDRRGFMELQEHLVQLYHNSNTATAVG